MQKTSTTTTTTNKCKLNAKAFQKQNTVTTTTNKCKLNARAFQLEQNKCTSPPERVPIRTKLLQHERDLLTKSKIGKQIPVFRFVILSKHTLNLPIHRTSLPYLLLNKKQRKMNNYGIMDLSQITTQNVEHSFKVGNPA